MCSTIPVLLVYLAATRFVALVGWLSRPRTADDRLPAPAP